MKASYLRQATKDAHGSLYILLINQVYPSYRISLGHLDRLFLDERHYFRGELRRAEAEGAMLLRRWDIVALSGDSGLEGDATAMYLRQQLQPFQVRLTRLARGSDGAAFLRALDEAGSRFGDVVRRRLGDAGDRSASDRRSGTA